MNKPGNNKQLSIVKIIKKGPVGKELHTNMSYTNTNSKLNLDTDVLNQKNYNNNQAFTDSFDVDILTEDAGKLFKSAEAKELESMDLLRQELWSGTLDTKINVSLNLQKEVEESNIFATSPKYYKINILNSNTNEKSYFYVFIFSLWFLFLILFAVYLRSRSKSNADNI